MTTKTTIATLPRELEAAIPSSYDPLLARTLVRQLAVGEPVPVERLADALERPAATVERELAGLPGVYRDDRERIVGFWGLAVAEMPHRMRLDGRTVYGWCAWDTLFLPIVIGEPVRVESRCPQTGSRVALSVSPGGFGDLAPAGGVMTFLRPPEGGFSGDVIRSFCHFVHFLASAGAAQAWTAEREGTFQLSIAEGFDLARFWAGRVFGVDAGTA